MSMLPEASSLRSEVCCPRVTCFLLLAFCFFMNLVFHVMYLVSSSSYLQSCLKSPICGLLCMEPQIVCVISFLLLFDFFFLFKELKSALIPSFFTFWKIQVSFSPWLLYSQPWWGWGRGVEGGEWEVLIPLCTALCKASTREEREFP